MKILITGCAKSGTTLVRRLFQAFELNTCVKEYSLFGLLRSEFDVAKRTGNTIFSNIVSPRSILKQVETIKKEDVKIINVIRGKEDTLKSYNNYVSPERYKACVRQFYKHKDLITYNIKYEELIEDPDGVMWEVCEALNLTPLFMWSDYPTFVDESKEQFTYGNYSLRKIGEPYDLDN